MESFQIMRQMVDNESWFAFPINLADHGGIIGIIKQHITRDVDIDYDEDEEEETISTSPPDTNTNNIPKGSSRRKSMINYSQENSSTTPDTSLHSPTKATSNSGQKIATEGNMKILSKFRLGNPFHFMTNTSDEGDNSLSYSSGGSVLTDGSEATTTEAYAAAAAAAAAAAVAAVAANAAPTAPTPITTGTVRKAKI
jgi:hypothetical protein